MVIDIINRYLAICDVTDSELANRLMIQYRVESNRIVKASLSKEASATCIVLLCDAIKRRLGSMGGEEQLEAALGLIAGLL